MTGDRFIEWIIEDDDSLTAVCEKCDGQRYELRGCRITDVDNGVVVESGASVVPVRIERRTAPPPSGANGG